MKIEYCYKHEWILTIVGKHGGFDRRGSNQRLLM